MIDRRKVLQVLAGAGAMTTTASRAHASAKMHRIGLLSAIVPITEDTPNGALLLRDLAELGYARGGTLAIESRGADGKLNALPRLVTELVAAKVGVIVALGFPSALAAKQGTSLPIIAVNAGDPVATGLVASLANPGGNVTGVSDVATELTAKRIQLLKEFAPQVRRVAMLWNADDLGMSLRQRASEDAAKALGVAVQPLGVRAPDDFEQAFSAMRRELPDAILMVSDSLINLNRRRIIEFAAEHHLPTIFEAEFYVRDGGLMSYAADQRETFGRVASLIGRILKGAKPAELPVEQPTRFRFVLNLKTAKALGLTIPPAILVRADEVIE